MRRSLARSKLAHPLITAAAASSTGSPASVRLSRPPPTTRVTTTANSTQPMTRYASRYQALAHSPGKTAGQPGYG